MKVIKRDETREEFNEVNIRRVINLASKSVEKEHQLTEEKIEKVLGYILKNLPKKEEVEVEEIQDLVEDGLMKENCFEVAKSFILYREERAKERFKKLSIIKEIKEKLEASNIQNQNANLDEASFGGRKGEADSALLKQMALDYYISPKFAKNHINNRVYIHDLDSYLIGEHNCLSVPIDELLANGFKTRQVFIRPAGSANTAFQLVAVLFQLQSLQQFGGVAATHLDWSLVPYVRKSFMKHYIVAALKDARTFKKINLPQMMFEDYNENGIWRNKLEDWIDNNKEKILKKLKLKKEDFYFDNKKLNKKYRQSAIFDTIQEVKQAAEGMLHNLNSLQSRSGNQLPFSSINYGTCTEEEGRIVSRAILSATIKGVGNGQTSIFPCQIFQKMKGINDKGSKNYDLYQLAIRSTAKRMYPNYCNCDWSQDQGYNKKDPRTYPSTMGCRTYSGWDINAPDEEHKHMKDGRGNIAPATIILPALAMEAKKKSKDNPEYIVDYFMDILKTAIGDCKDELIERFNWICAQSPASARFMYENNTFYSYGDDFEKEGIRGALKHGTLAIGQIGLAETLQILVGCDHTEEKGMELAKKIEQLFKDKCKEYKEHYKLNFGVYYTPAENLCNTSYQKFLKKYGLIENVTAYKDENGDLKPRGYFTNSIHVPVWKEITPFEKIDIESQLTGYSSAGCITYVEIGDNAQNNLTALEQIVDYAMAKDIPYFALNVRFSDCEKCGYSGYIEYDAPCPVCGASHEYIDDYARITGYLSVKRSMWNKGKQAEGKDRYVHVNKLTTWKK